MVISEAVSFQREFASPAVAGRFPLLADENIDGGLIEELLR